MNSIDYSQKTNWYKIPEITRDVDTFLHLRNGVYCVEFGGGCSRLRDP